MGLDGGTATINPAPTVTSGLATTINTITDAVSTFLSDAWPALVGLIVVLLFVMVALRFGLGAFKHFIRFGRA